MSNKNNFKIYSEYYKNSINHKDCLRPSSEYNFSYSKNLNTDEINDINDYIWNSEENVNQIIFDEMKSLENNENSSRVNKSHFDNKLEEELNNFESETSQEIYSSKTQPNKVFSEQSNFILRKNNFGSNNLHTSNERFLINRCTSEEFDKQNFMKAYQEQYENLQQKINHRINEFKKEIIDQKINYKRELEMMKQYMLNEINKCRSTYERLCQNYEKQILHLEAENLELKNKTKKIKVLVKDKK
jgi:hypothetical protein